MTHPSDATLVRARKLLDELLPWSFAAGALVLMLAPSIDDPEAENPDAVSLDEAGGLVVHFVLIQREPDSGEIVDVSEQPVLLIPELVRHGPARARNYLMGLRLALDQTVQRVPAEPRLPEHFMFSEVLADTALTTRDDFARALAAPTRLGQYASR